MIFSQQDYKKQRKIICRGRSIVVVVCLHQSAHAACVSEMGLAEEGKGLKMDGVKREMGGRKKGFCRSIFVDFI